MSSSSTETTLVDVVMPQMGVSVSEGTVVEWRKHPGDWVEADEIICSISTDKIDTDVEAPATGRVQEILVEVGATVDVGTVMARIATDARPGEAHASEAVPTSEAAAAEGATPAAATTSPSPEPAAATPRDAPGSSDGRRYSPVVQRIAAQHGVDLARVAGTGRGGRVRKQDVLAFIEQGAPAAEEPPLHIESPYRAEPAAPEPVAAGTLSRMRRQIGEHMKRSLEVAATCTTWIEADMSAVEAARARLGTTALPIVARCAIDALREFPSLNAWLEGDAYTVHDAVHLGVAVSLGEDGLIVPVIHDAQDLAPEGLAKRIRDLARRARAKELRPDDVAGGTFTITNPGQYGSIMATPVINQPQVAILDLEAVVKRAVVVDDAIAIRP
ncbi:MAG TPA: dihydrolipoamide acetyltransferase family protein, partial [Solirubrobacteraceae bacterium]